ncbi:MAG: high frequency lysogenization protein HflD [Gammaproteobacteria bacterium]|nr:high frequency lysogenization protein HflD [Gammaproteobacteria bacterium]MBU1653398.1 high frequency lysogenization protein HflD [Gammaproteobacteria bacterium]MBU1960714.1 high frequency lysogenization protein HflD [Gammaproteobacteria bacterium]
MKTARDRGIALAGIYQAAGLVAQIAHEGRCDPVAREASIFSLLQTDAENTAAVFGGVAGVEFGLRSLHRHLTNARESREVIGYLMHLIHLNGVLRKRPLMLEIIAQGLAEAVRRRDHFGLTHPNTLAHFADIYSRTLSSLQPRIMVQGEPLHLNNPDNANQIRTLLLAGIRSALLWRQCGGNRFQIILGRKRLLRQVQALLDELGRETP